MRFFSGFSLRGEEALFGEYLYDDDYTVAGFSKGAIDAMHHALQSSSRIERLQLFSPAYFVEKSPAFKRVQLHYFRKDPEGYLATFLQNASYPSGVDLRPYLQPEGIEALERLLQFAWAKEDLQRLVDRGISIEVYLGGCDKIIDPHAAKRHFLPYATCYFIKEGGHILNG